MVNFAGRDVCALGQSDACDEAITATTTVPRCGWKKREEERREERRREERRRAEHMDGSCALLFALLFALLCFSFFFFGVHACMSSHVHLASLGGPLCV